MRLIGDIGGTKTLLASVTSEDKINNTISLVECYKSQQYQNFEAILQDYLSKIKSLNFESLCLAVAGPVRNNFSKLTNLDWNIDGQQLSELNNIKKTFVYNDLEAIAAAVCNDCSGVENICLTKLISSETSLNNICTKVVVAPGTGLGVAYAIAKNQNYYPYPSQAGHINFAPVNSLEYELLQYMQAKTNKTQIGVEMVCSGIGIANIFHFFLEYKGLELESNLMYELQNSEDLVPVIIKHALNSSSIICTKTIDLFLEILAGFLQTVTLTMYSLNGIYLAGGIAVALQEFLVQEKFLVKIFNNSTMNNILKNIDIYLCLNKNVALIGASKLLELK